MKPYITNFEVSRNDILRSSLFGIHIFRIYSKNYSTITIYPFRYYSYLKHDYIASTMQDI